MVTLLGMWGVMSDCQGAMSRQSTLLKAVWKQPCLKTTKTFRIKAPSRYCCSLEKLSSYRVIKQPVWKMTRIFLSILDILKRAHFQINHAKFPRADWNGASSAWKKEAGWSWCALHLALTNVLEDLRTIDKTTERLRWAWWSKNHWWSSIFVLNHQRSDSESPALCHHFCSSPVFFYPTRPRVQHGFTQFRGARRRAMPSPAASPWHDACPLGWWDAPRWICL